jgi:hypothetical protein
MKSWELHAPHQRLCRRDRLSQCTRCEQRRDSCAGATVGLGVGSKENIATGTGALSGFGEESYAELQRSQAHARPTTSGISGDFAGAGRKRCNDEPVEPDFGEMDERALEARIGVEPTNKGFADLRFSQLKILESVQT